LAAPGVIKRYGARRIAVLDGVPARDAVGYVRERYDSRAVETPWQRRFVARFSGPVDVSLADIGLHLPGCHRPEEDCPIPGGALDSASLV
jgi:hypothetical protein